MFVLPGILSQKVMVVDNSFVTYCDNSAPSTLIAEEIGAFLLTYSADHNSVTWCDNSAPSTLIAAT